METREQRNSRMLLYAECGKFNEVKIAIQDGSVDINYQSDVGYSLLIFAVSLNKIDVVEWLLVHGADVNARQWEGLTVLMFAKTAEMVKLLAKYRSDPLLLSNYGKNAFEYMLLNGDYDAIDAYLECGFQRPPVNKYLERMLIKERDLKRWAILMGHTVSDEQFYHLAHIKQTRNEKQIYSAFYKIRKEVSVA